MYRQGKGCKISINPPLILLCREAALKSNEQLIDQNIRAGTQQQEGLIVFSTPGNLFTFLIQLMHKDMENYSSTKLLHGIC